MAWGGVIPMKMTSENHFFNMLKWIIFDQRFESQTSKVKFDPFIDSELLNTLIGIYIEVKPTPETIKSKV